jgi:hypothetical protein
VYRGAIRQSSRLRSLDYDISRFAGHMRTLFLSAPNLWPQDVLLLTLPSGISVAYRKNVIIIGKSNDRG